MLRQLRPILAEGQDDLKLVAPPAEESFPKRALSGGGTWPFGCHRNANRPCDCALSGRAAVELGSASRPSILPASAPSNRIFDAPARLAGLTFIWLHERCLRLRHFKPGNRTFRVVSKTDSVDTIRRLQLSGRHYLGLVVARHYGSVDRALHLSTLDR
jgi:hypothetical protein